MLRNYFLLHGAYKRITHTKKVEIGDWVLIKTRGKKSPSTTIYVGQVLNTTKSDSVDLQVGEEDVYLVDTEGLLKVPRTKAGKMRARVKDPGTQAYLWQSQWRLFRESDRPKLTETVLYFIFTALN